MEKDFVTPEYKSGESKRGKHITAFTAVKQDYGLQIKVAGCVCLQEAQSGAQNVIGIVELDDQVVPVLDARKESNDDITDLSCIVLFENVVGQTTIVTGRLYDSACQVFDLIVEFMDQPEAHEHLYTPMNHFQACDSTS